MSSAFEMLIALKDPFAAHFGNKLLLDLKYIWFEYTYIHGRCFGSANNSYSIVYGHIFLPVSEQINSKMSNKFWLNFHLLKLSLVWKARYANEIFIYYKFRLLFQLLIQFSSCHPIQEWLNRFPWEINIFLVQLHDDHDTLFFASGFAVGPAVSTFV